ncbi:DUF3068 domain-containing protein [Streptomyces sp. GXMU-J15]|uniref:DUF3068 domain-containing protein n=1 Tax=Streptomyces fuscus TaxID=3048495 RepID=A0ABT7IZ57_9ACTN|nr:MULTISPECIES: DUF3068 domain-containing protein [Streptomyces]MDL2077872.1 DUF3068 domain-containing protein [Streptomyces fuscus]SBT88437.1 Protein of unknown function [Streptomyces sp. DI166]
MRRTASPFSLIMLGLGTFLLVLAPMLAWYVEPRAAVNPIDIDTTAVYKGTGSVFDLEKVATVPDKTITVTQRVRGNVAESEKSGNAVWDVITTVDTDESLPAADPHDALDYQPHRWVLDRETTRPVHCCEEKPYIEGEAYLKFPFDVQKRDYRWWDNTLGGVVTMRYQGEKKIQGYTGYRFTASVPAAKTGTRLVPGRLVNLPDRPQVLAEEWYANHGIELVVDQATGRVLYAQTGPRRTLRAPGGTKDEAVLLDSRKIAFTTATQKEAVERAEEDSGRLRLVGQTLPIGAAVTGFVLALAGIVLVVRGRRHPDSSESSGSAVTM